MLLWRCFFHLKMKKLYIETYGCQMNVAADAVFLNTCSVRDNAEQKIYHRLDALDAIRRQRAKNQEPKANGMIIGVLGCMAERVKDDLLEHHHCDLVAGPDAYLSLPDLIADL